MSIESLGGPECCSGASPANGVVVMSRPYVRYAVGAGSTRPSGSRGQSSRR
jgi:hypothetical protein